jgi:hypothetical protein
VAKQASAQQPSTPRKYQLIPVTDMTGGLDLRTAPSLLASDRAQVLTNWSLSEPGSLVVRPGYTAVSTAALSSGRINGAARVYLNTTIPNAASTIFTLVNDGANGTVHTMTDNGVFSVARLSGRSTVNEVYFPADRDLVAVFDSSSVPMKSTNGSSWTRFGIAPPSTLSLSSVASGTLLASEFEVSYTFKDRDLAYESNGATTPSTITLISTGAIQAVLQNSTDAQVDALVVYCRNVTSGETVLRKFSSQAQAGGPTTTVTINSSNWTTGAEIPNNHTVPPVLSFGVVWKNRWWARSATVTNRLHFTELFQPQSWPGLFFLDLPFVKGDNITAIQPLGDALLIFGETTVFVIVGQNSLEFDVRPTLTAEDGAFGPRAVCLVENSVLHAGASGAYLFDGTSDRLLSHDIDPAWQDLVTNSTPAALSRIAVVYHHKRKEIRVAVPRRYPTSVSGEWVLDMIRTRLNDQRPAWSATDRNIGIYLPLDGPETGNGFRGELWATNGSTTGLVFHESVGTTANSSNLMADYQGPALNMAPFRGRWIDLRGQYEPHAGTLTSDPDVDGTPLGSQTLSIGIAGGSVYGTAQYGTATYAGAGRRQFFKMLPLMADGRTYTQRFTYSGQDDLRLFGYHVGVVPEAHTRDFAE